IALEVDEGLDGLKETTTYHYDDAARVTTRSVTNAAGHAVGSGTSAYDDDNRLVHRDDSSHDEGSNTVRPTSTEDHTYRGDEEVSYTSSYRLIDPDGEMQLTTERWDWQYDHCP